MVVVVVEVGAVPARRPGGPVLRRARHRGRFRPRRPARLGGAGGGLCPYKKRKLRHTERYQGHRRTEERPYGGGMGKGSRKAVVCKPKRQRSRETPNLLTPGLLASRAVRK